ncbi:MAG: response regulator transcription factor [Alphaproteobacteria bacterium]|nr:response regulator transcription factor [Alphaproteobacteria bacterium]
MAARILLVEDDRELAQLTAEYLTSQGFVVDLAYDGRDVAARVLACPPDALVLDLGLPGRDGLEICRDVRKDYAGPIVMLTARADELDEIVGLEHGADDYIGKPASPRKLALRLEAVLRRNRLAEPQEAYEDADLSLDPARRALVVRGTQVDVTAAEFELVALLVSHMGRPLSRDAYFRHATGAPYDGLDRGMDIRMSHVRRKLLAGGLPPARLSTIRGVGYQLNLP